MKTRTTALLLCTILCAQLIACGSLLDSATGGDTPPPETNVADNTSTSDTTPTPPPDDGDPGSNQPQGTVSEFLYAQLNLNGNSSDLLGTVTQVSGGSLFFTAAGAQEGNSVEDFLPPRISDFTLFINGEAHQLDVRTPMDGSVLLFSRQRDAGLSPEEHYPYVPKDEDTVIQYYLNYGFFEQYPAEYYFEVTVNDVRVRSNTFVWHADGTGEYLDDMPQPPQELTLIRRDSLAPPDPADPNERGNSNSNIINSDRSYASDKGDWIYIVRNGEIYKMSSDSTQLIHLEPQGYDFRAPLNVVGDWIYSFNRRGLHRIRTDGMGSEQIFDENFPSKLRLFIEGDWIYYDVENSADYTSIVSKIRTDGTEYTALTSEDFCSIIGIQDDWVYYTRWDGSDYGNAYSGMIFRVKKDGSAEDSIVVPYDSTAIVEGDWIYYDTYDDGATLKKIHIDTRETVTLLKMDQWFEFAVSGDTVFYVPWDETWYLHKIGTDGTGDMQMNSIRSRYINVAGDWVFYRADGKIHRIRTDGTGDELVFAEE